MSKSKNRKGQMSLAQHFVELRRRVMWSALAIVLATVIGWFLTPFVLNQMRAPIVAAAVSQHRLAELNYDSLTGAFDLRISVALTIGIVLSSVVWLYQIWAFLVPALSRRERRYSFGFFFSAVPLFLAGCCAGWLVMPQIVSILTGFAGSGSSSLIQANAYFTFILKLVVAAGIAFVLPVFLVLLNFVGVLSAKSIRKSWRVALLLIFVFTAFITPSADVISMFALAVPMTMLYVAAATVATVHDRRRRTSLEVLLSGSDLLNLEV